jgi:hypothetical protein
VALRAAQPPRAQPPQQRNLFSLRMPCANRSSSGSGRWLARPRAARRRASKLNLLNLPGPSACLLAYFLLCATEADRASTLTTIIIVHTQAIPPAAPPAALPSPCPRSPSSRS